MPTSLLNLWQGHPTRVDTDRGPVSQHVRQPGLIATVAQILATTRPRLIRTLDDRRTHGSDHSDHVFVGTLTDARPAADGSDRDMLLYRGYNIELRARRP